jgi:hypothetical protein
VFDIIFGIREGLYVVNNEWKAPLNERSELTGDDFLILQEMIESIE